jgi:hypothetical protein
MRLNMWILLPSSAGLLRYFCRPSYLKVIMNALSSLPCTVDKYPLQAFVSLLALIHVTYVGLLS